jgi:hypothetical protein
MGHSMTESYEQWKRRELRAALQRLKLEDRLPESYDDGRPSVHRELRAALQRLKLEDRLPESYDDGRPSVHKYSVKGDPLLKRLWQFHREK